jgi:hypothetical protein
MFSCGYCLEEGHSSNNCYIFDTNRNSKFQFGFKNERLIYKLLWQVVQERHCLNKIQHIIKLAESNNIKLNLTFEQNMMFRSACYLNDINLVEYLLKKEPKINVRCLSDSAFINACWEYELTGSFKGIILLLIREEPYIYSYSFATKEKKINTIQEEKEARWKTKRQAVMASSYLKENDTILNRLPSELSRIVIEYLYKK